MLYESQWADMIVRGAVRATNETGEMRAICIGGRKERSDREDDRRVETKTKNVRWSSVPSCGSITASSAKKRRRRRDEGDGARLTCARTPRQCTELGCVSERCRCTAKKVKCHARSREE